jgi:hypothetical protein
MYVCTYTKFEITRTPANDRRRNEVIYFD